MATINEGGIKIQKVYLLLKYNSYRVIKTASQLTKPLANLQYLLKCRNGQSYSVKMLEGRSNNTGVRYDSIVWVVKSYKELLLIGYFPNDLSIRAFLIMTFSKPSLLFRHFVQMAGYSYRIFTKITLYDSCDKLCFLTVS